MTEWTKLRDIQMNAMFGFNWWPSLKCLTRHWGMPQAFIRSIGLENCLFYFYIPVLLKPAFKRGKFRELFDKTVLHLNESSCSIASFMFIFVCLLEGLFSKVIYMISLDNHFRTTVSRTKLTQNRVKKSIPVSDRLVLPDPTLFWYQAVFGVIYIKNVTSLKVYL